MKRILVTGINGQLGQELQQTLASSAEVIGVGRERVDFSQPESLRQIIAEVKPDAVINAAAYTAVDKAESEFDLAMAVNGTAPGILAEECQKLRIRLIHISTDYVFDGTKSYPYQDTDPTNPLSAYGKSKLEGELAIGKNCEDRVILRTAWVYGVGGKGNFVKTMLRLGSDKEEIRVVADQIGSPTWTGDLANAIASLLDQTPPGTYHYTNSGVASWYDFAVAIFEEASQLGWNLKVQRVVPITTPEYPTPAKRPAYSVLSCAKITAVLGTYPPHWRQGLRQMLRDFSQSKL
ncbi:dTDP-4-dehydrorhamnose reductase [Microseira wollei]|uniref:dTDP-4-dehydrorhamnose reductase n=1 Tax=Microseira wollei NIES-4236 TaxID=2530354 RepID=A0AAV3WG39_9CYAN|nr:dTDP-4-dehydrorhamnose reductase [Microseira wollei]GET37179.1 dTDP-4-dehydrorhamnose reductase [Microseira wollei NIES-4236]